MQNFTTLLQKITTEEKRRLDLWTLVIWLVFDYVYCIARLKKDK